MESINELLAETRAILEKCTGRPLSGIEKNPIDMLAELEEQKDDIKIFLLGNISAEDLERAKKHYEDIKAREESIRKVLRTKHTDQEITALVKNKMVYYQCFKNFKLYGRADLPSNNYVNILSLKSYKDMLSKCAQTKGVTDLRKALREVKCNCTSIHAEDDNSCAVIRNLHLELRDGRKVCLHNYIVELTELAKQTGGVGAAKPFELKVDITNIGKTAQYYAVNSNGPIYPNVLYTGNTTNPYADSNVDMTHNNIPPYKFYDILKQIQLGCEKHIKIAEDMPEEFYKILAEKFVLEWNTTNPLKNISIDKYNGKFMRNLIEQSYLLSLYYEFFLKEFFKCYTNGHYFYAQGGSQESDVNLLRIDPYMNMRNTVRGNNAGESKFGLSNANLTALKYVPSAPSEIKGVSQQLDNIDKMTKPTGVFNQLRDVIYHKENDDLYNKFKTAYDKIMKNYFDDNGARSKETPLPFDKEYKLLIYDLDTSMYNAYKMTQPVIIEVPIQATYALENIRKINFHDNTVITAISSANNAKYALYRDITDNKYLFSKTNYSSTGTVTINNLDKLAKIYNIPGAMTNGATFNTNQQLTHKETCKTNAIPPADVHPFSNFTMAPIPLMDLTGRDRTDLGLNIFGDQTVNGTAGSNRYYTSDNQPLFNGNLYIPVLLQKYILELLYDVGYICTMPLLADDINRYNTHTIKQWVETFRRSGDMAHAYEYQFVTTMLNKMLTSDYYQQSDLARTNSDNIKELYKLIEIERAEYENITPMFDAGKPDNNTLINVTTLNKIYEYKKNDSEANKAGDIYNIAIALDIYRYSPLINFENSDYYHATGAKLEEVRRYITYVNPLIDVDTTNGTVSIKPNYGIYRQNYLDNKETADQQAVLKLKDYRNTMSTKLGLIDHKYKTLKGGNKNTTLALNKIDNLKKYYENFFKDTPADTKYLNIAKWLNAFIAYMTYDLYTDHKNPLAGVYKDLGESFFKVCIKSTDIALNKANTDAWLVLTVYVLDDNINSDPLIQIYTDALDVIIKYTYSLTKVLIDQETTNTPKEQLVAIKASPLVDFLSIPVIYSSDIIDHLPNKTNMQDENTRSAEIGALAYPQLHSLHTAVTNKQQENINILSEQQRFRESISRDKKTLLKNKELYLQYTTYNSHAFKLPGLNKYPDTTDMLGYNQITIATLNYYKDTINKIKSSTASDPITKYFKDYHHYTMKRVLELLTFLTNEQYLKDVDNANAGGVGYIPLFPNISNVVVPLHKIIVTTELRYIKLLVGYINLFNHFYPLLDRYNEVKRSRVSVVVRINDFDTVPTTPIDVLKYTNYQTKNNPFALKEYNRIVTNDPAQGDPVLGVNVEHYVAYFKKNNATQPYFYPRNGKLSATDYPKYNVNLTYATGASGQEFVYRPSVVKAALQNRQAKISATQTNSTYYETVDRAYYTNNNNDLNPTVITPVTYNKISAMNVNTETEVNILKEHNEYLNTITETNATIRVENVFDSNQYSDATHINMSQGISADISKGKGITIMTYGFSGTGKTVTLCGKSTSVRGLLQDIFGKFTNNTILFRVYEIYGLGTPYSNVWTKQNNYLTKIKTNNINPETDIQPYQILFKYKLKLVNDSIVVDGDPTEITDLLNIQDHVNIAINTPLVINDYVTLDSSDYINNMELLLKDIDKHRLNVGNKNSPTLNIPLHRIKATVNNPESSRSIMIYEFQVKIDTKYVTVTILDLPGKEEPKTTFITSNLFFDSKPTTKENIDIYSFVFDMANIVTSHIDKLVTPTYEYKKGLGGIFYEAIQPAPEHVIKKWLSCVILGRIIIGNIFSGLVSENPEVDNTYTGFRGYTYTTYIDIYDTLHSKIIQSATGTHINDKITAQLETYTISQIMALTIPSLIMTLLEYNCLGVVAKLMECFATHFMNKSIKAKDILILFEAYYINENVNGLLRYILQELKHTDVSVINSYIKIVPNTVRTDYLSNIQHVASLNTLLAYKTGTLRYNLNITTSIASLIQNNLKNNGIKEDLHTEINNEVADVTGNKGILTKEIEKYIKTLETGYKIDQVFGTEQALASIFNTILVRGRLIFLYLVTNNDTELPKGPEQLKLLIDTKKFIELAMKE